MKVTVYDKENCAKCKNTEMFLKNKGVEFETKDVFEPEHEDVLNWARESGNTSMPLVFVNDEFAWSDLRPDKIIELANKYHEEA